MNDANPYFFKLASENQKKFSPNNNNNNNKGPQPTLRLSGAEQCRQIALFLGYDTTRAPLLEGLIILRKLRSTHCIDPGGMKHIYETPNI